ncbi:hypothetical protein RO3G_08939 [Lichtheimia corymbifera JMRC:FSU:9682]|uniref:Secreted protein n=1 Tax=Lichtheimia corymbifera JMRC:FSU:9682 TaxID=1263082 RepID=A0A068RJW7_9FUNG|nr:hypothetical protein RO3G_08939 [Lichtheimia corymbifera JMRC:FSU:9682]
MLLGFPRFIVLLSTVSCFGSRPVSADGLIQVNSPASNQVLGSNTDNVFQYTVVGAQTVGISNPYYPNSINVDLQWQQRNNDSNTLRINVISGLAADSAPAGISNKQYTSTWKLPGCHFFTRYNTAQYGFSLIVSPNYAALSPNQTAPGPEEPSQTIPLQIQVNNGTFPKC